MFRAGLKMGLFDSLTKGMEAMIGATAQILKSSLSSDYKN
jgi:hypothetical protein